MEGKEGRKEVEGRKAGLSFKGSVLDKPFGLSPPPPSPPPIRPAGFLRPPAPRPQAPHSIPGTFQSQLEGGQLNGESIMENRMAGP